MRKISEEALDKLRKTNNYYIKLGVDSAILSNLEQKSIENGRGALEVVDIYRRLVKKYIVENILSKTPEKFLNTYLDLKLGDDCSINNVTKHLVTLECLKENIIIENKEAVLLNSKINECIKNILDKNSDIELSKITRNKYLKELIKEYCRNKSLTYVDTEIDITREINLEKCENYNQETIITNNQLNDYVNSLPKITLTGEEEYILAYQMKNGNMESRKKLIEANLRLVVNVAFSKYSYRGPDDILDLIGIGNIGLIKAVDKFNPDYGYKFSSYAVDCITTEMERKNNLDSYKLSARKSENMRKLKAARNKLSALYNDKIDIESLIDETGLTKEQIEELMKYDKTVISLNSKIYKDNEERCLEEIIPDNKIGFDQEIIDEVTLDELIKHLKKKLTKKQFVAINTKLGLSTTSGEITFRESGEKLNVPRQNISELYRNGIKRLKNDLFLKSIR